MSNPLPLADVLRANTIETIRAARDAQASRILDALDALVDPGQAAAYGTDEHGVAWVRHPTLGTFRGLSMRDALAQLLTARGLL